ncbi:MAG: asparagine synthase (glutamine-hydrolyzing) [Gammaproteobacteria bacterium]|nr:asparagine synthase (glutamine-hydrolyzing) [Gammaproteobacteria bacterium]NIM71851.1 asparagine synthase (glutamine-hydrolyzing) [Gammaproteobacteria bacterium]NIN37973.1 asparagine synthase (glutamine-hydrolyzing) [Gammaproteobacteria bacterium]NIO23607.1 asparagine synthase (glutamine-hydrolyzing) [Gammaproteobacteria bacterium]NIO64223.1 asparagine synthase (glutamine-hydrolyzing) [Gammaproteobacteria bacterium]
MCGVAAIYSYHYAAEDIERSELRAIRDRMQSRGPDDDGEWYSEDNRVGLGHRRLSIIDLSKQAAQPMTSQCGRYVISYNGEIYNYKSLRAGLESAGTRFATDSDTEVVLEMFRRYGTDMFNHLRGMYALAIWDTLERRMLLARDPFGIKPLYYADDGWTCRVASQVKALRAIGQISDDPEPAGHVGFLLFGSVPEPFTLWREIRAVPAGTYVWVDRSGIGAPRKYFDLPSLYECDSARSTDDSLSEAIEDSVRHHMVADVPVGAFLSSGLDSSVLVAMMSKCATTPIKTVTVGFEEFRGTSADEVPLAEEVASAFNTQHTTRLVSREEFEQDLPKILHAMDQPTIDGINVWFASKACAEIGLKVAVSGLGGDEISAGYPTFRVLPNWYRKTRFAGKIPGLGSMLRGILAPLRPLTGINAKAVGMLEYGGSLAGLYLLKRGLFMPWELPDLVGRELAREGLKRLDPLENLERSGYRNADTPGARISVLEQSCYMRNQLLRDADWASMAHSLEVRVPFVDPVLQRQVFRHGRPTSKAEIAKVSSLLPKAMLTRQKSGFETPVENWISKCGIESKTPKATEHWSRRWARSINQHFGDGCAFSH